jgi:hypothetical protein
MQLRKLRRGMPEHEAVLGGVLSVHGKLLSRGLLSEQHLHGAIGDGLRGQGWDVFELPDVSNK